MHIHSLLMGTRMTQHKAMDNLSSSRSAELMRSHSSIRATAGPSVLLQTRRDRQRERLERKRETVTMAH